ncbi:MAG: elongation factor Ts, partial [Parcubacteria group bacterium]
AKNPEFKAVAREIAMHIAAMKPENTTELLEQPFIKNPSQTIADLINGTIQKFGERTEIGRFERFSIK